MSNISIIENSAPATASVTSVVVSFTPSLMSEQTLRDIFVARQPLVDRLVRDIRDATTSGARRHALLVGPRGIGKTHLVSMVYYAVKADADVYGRLRIAWLREEEWSVFSYADLLVRIFRALANEYPGERVELNAFADRLMRLPIDEGARVGEAKLLEWLGERLLLLIAENFNDLLEGIGAAGQQSLRAFLQNYSRAVLITTSPALTSDLSEHDSPFYGYFNVTHLKELTREEARQLLIRIATTVEHNDELAAYLQTDEADRRLRVIETLAGGHPRIWILFSGCMSRRLLDELVPLFVKMLDDLTPYYQDRMRVLPVQERRIIVCLCERSGAAPVKEIAADCRLKPNAAAALLGNLEEKGYVRKAREPIAVSVGDRRIAYYEMREPLMRLCIEIKENRADPLRLIVEFLRCWFSEDDIKQRLRSLPAHAAMTRHYMEATLARMTEIRQVFSDLISVGKHHLTVGSAREALESYDRAIALEPADASAWNDRGIALGRLERLAEALESFDRAVALKPDYVPAWRNRGVVLDRLERWNEALESYDCAVALKPDYTSVWFNRGIVLDRLERWSEALESLDHAVALQPDDPDTWNYRGIVLGWLERPAEALESYDQAIALKPDDASAWFNRGIVLGWLERPAEALESYDQAIALKPDDASAWFNRGVVLGRLERPAEALESYDRAVALQPDDASAWNNRGVALDRLERWNEALESYDRAVALEPEDGVLHSNRAECLAALQRFDEAIAALVVGLDAPHRDMNGLQSAAATVLRKMLLTPVHRNLWSRWAETLASAFFTRQSAPLLAFALTQTIPTLFSETVTDALAQAWLTVWEAAVKGQPQMDVALRILRAAVEWRQTRDRGAILRLATEERTVLEELLPHE